MPKDATATRERLVDEGARAFAAHGVRKASLVDIARRAGQRNHSAVNYHFGSRAGLVCAVLDRHAPFLAAREGELLALALGSSDDDVTSVVEAVVRPSAELAASEATGPCFLQMVAELIDEDPAGLEPEIAGALARTGGEAVYGLLERRLARLPPEVYIERISVATSFYLRAVARRAHDPRGERGRPQLEEEAFVQNLVAMVTAALCAPVPPGADR